MYAYIEERVLAVASYIMEHGATVRAAAQVFDISKSTVHKDMTQRLKALDPAKAKAVQRILLHNKAERHIRGGLATYRKYKGESPLAVNGDTLYTKEHGTREQGMERGTI